jgi:hypothetical protein
LRIPFALPLLTAMGLALSAQTAPEPAAPAAAPAAPAIKWRGALWASGAASDHQTADGSLFLRSMDAGDGHFALDALQLGADVTLAEGWSLKFTLLAGQDAKILNAASLDSGSIAFPEAMLVWTGAKDTLRFGRMYTAMGMEVLDHTQNATASRGLLFTYAIPLTQVGLNWHHAFTPSWSSDLFLYNGEDRVQDNNKGKTAGLGLTYNHGGAADKFVTLMAYSGPEQDGLAAKANTGAEGRKRERLCLTAQWVWGASTLQFEGEHAQEPFAAGAIQGSRGTADVKAAWSGAGLIYKYQVNEAWAAVARAETLKDDTGVRLSWDPTVAAAYGSTRGVELQATGCSLGLERRWKATFTRLEVRQDRLNKDVHGSDGKAFRDATSATWSLGTSF